LLNETQAGVETIVFAAPGFGDLWWAIIAGTVGPLGFWGGRERTDFWAARSGAFAAAADAAGEELCDRSIVGDRFVGMDRLLMEIFRRLEGIGLDLVQHIVDRQC